MGGRGVGGCWWVGGGGRRGNDSILVTWYVLNGCESNDETEQKE